MSLEERFRQRCLNLADAIAAARGPYPGYLRQGIERDGAVATVTRLVSGDPSSTFVELFRMNRLDLTVEAVIQESQWLGLFSEETRERARVRLAECGWEPGGSTGET